MLIILSAFLLGIVALLSWSLWQRQRRQRTLAQLLDLADSVERLLNESQERMHALRPLVRRVPADIAAQAQASLESSLPIREAKRDVLQHRLWIQKHGLSADQQALDQACAALGRVHARLQVQLKELANVGSDLASATDAAAEAALREPPGLRRNPDP